MHIYALSVKRKHTLSGLKKQGTTKKKHQGVRQETPYVLRGNTLWFWSKHLDVLTKTTYGLE